MSIQSFDLTLTKSPQVDSGISLLELIGHKAGYPFRSYLLTYSLIHLWAYYLNKPI